MVHTERWNFFNTVPHPQESTSDYVNRLVNVAVDCDFENFSIKGAIMQNLLAHSGLTNLRQTILDKKLNIDDTLVWAKQMEQKCSAEIVSVKEELDEDSYEIQSEETDFVNPDNFSSMKQEKCEDFKFNSITHVDEDTEKLEITEETITTPATIVPVKTKNTVKSLKSKKQDRPKKINVGTKKQRMTREEYMNSFPKSKLCPFCGENFGNVTKEEQIIYQLHVKKHKLDEFSCECQETWENKAEKERHMKVKHEGYSQCTMCLLCVRNTTLLDRHMEKKHNENNKSTHLCNECGKSFSSHARLYAHQQYVHDKDIVKCDVCDKEFVGRYSMKDHRRKIHGNKPPCHICGVMVSNLRVHMKTVHTDEKDKKYVCDICNKGFLMKSSFKSHNMSVHIKARPFICRYGCSFAYNDVSNRNSHEKKKHGGLFEETNNYQHCQELP